MRILVAVLCLFTMTGCYRDSPTAPADQDVTLAPSQSAPVAGAGLFVRFVGVTGDSRCPADANCVLGGSATVRVDVTSTSGARQEVTFETGNLQPVTYGTLTLELVQLTPYPFSARPIKPEEYRATLRVKR